MIINGLISLLNFIIDSVGSLIGFIFAILPNSPFGSVSLSPISKWLGYLNYLLPIGEIISILTLWGSCVGVYYIYQIALRWIKVVE